ncbi:MAG: SDR family oxidoreductase [Bacillota bacterium]|nr:SDR family oxidoreductase [Bacillota bacterium]
MNLKGKSAIITGASSGIGRATAYKLAELGCDLIITARREERLKEVVQNCQQYGNQVYYVVGDAANEETAKACIDLCIEKFGKVDMMINNVGIGKVKSLIDSTIEDYDLIMNTNCRSMFLFSKYALMDMVKRDQGIIVVVSSITGYIGHKDETIYTMTKFAGRGFVEAINAEYKHKGIRASVICPNAIKTEFEVGDGRDAKEVENAIWQTPEDVADAIVFAVTRDKRSKITEIRLTH